MAGFFDGAFDPQTFNSGILPGWLVSALKNTPPEELMKGFQSLMAGGGQQQPPQDPAALPPNAQPASGTMPSAMPQDRMSIFTPRDGYAGDPPLNPMQGMPGMNAPGMGAMAQGPQAPMGAPQPQAQGGGMGGFQGAIGGLGDAIDSIRGLVHPSFGHRAGTAQALVKMGIDPQVAQAMSRDKSLMSVAGGSLLGFKSTDDIKEFEYAKKNGGFSGSFNDWMLKKRATSGEYGMTPIWGVGPDGKPAVLQLGKSGDAKQSALPPGFALSRDPIKVEGPTGTAILDPQTRQQVGFIPKDVQGAARQKEVGEAQGQGQVMLPNVVATAERTLKQIEEVEKHPGLPTATGLSGKLDPRNYVAGTDAANFEVRRKQLLGGTFLEAYQSLKGGGAITEVEGNKAQDAIARMDRAQSEGEFREALREYKEIVRSGIQRARTKAAGGLGGAVATTPSAAPMAIGWSDVGGGVRIREKP